MIKLLIIIVILLLACSINCRRQQLLSLNNHGPTQTIAFVPFNSFDISEIKNVLTEISTFYNKPVIILPRAFIPSNSFDHIIEQYSADSILDLLTKMKPDSIVEVVGLTNEPIFSINKKRYYEQKIFGFGDHPGNVCIVSDTRLKIADNEIYNSRLKKVIIHEIGHNMGLSHCKNDQCTMSEKNGNLKNLDNTEVYYCSDCRKKVNQ
jgi:archaemetzincin